MTTRPVAPPQPWLVWPSVLGVGVLAVRATTTLVGGASFATPGDGWRAVWQLLAAAILLSGLVDRRILRWTVGVIGVMYAIATGLELIDGSQLLGLIPVDQRDRIVHPLAAVIAFAGLGLTARASHHPSNEEGPPAGGPPLDDR
jgi:hypothetical protein